MKFLDSFLANYVSSRNHHFDQNFLVSPSQPLLVDCYESQRVFCWLKKAFREESSSNETNLGSVVYQRRTLVYVSHTIFVEADHNVEVNVLFVPFWHLRNSDM